LQLRARVRHAHVVLLPWLCRYDLDAALKFYEKAVGLEPDNTDLLDASGEICVQAGRSDDAIKLFTRSIELKPNENSCKYMNLGMLAAGHDSLNFYRKGMELMTAELGAATAAGDAAQVAKLKNQLCSGYCSICELHMTDLCDEETAEQTCEESLQRAREFAPNSPDLWVQWANLRLCQVNKEEAKKFTYQALSIVKGLEESDRPLLEVRCGIVKLLIECEQLDEAEEFARSLLEVDDQYIETWYLLALINYHQENWEDGFHCSASAIKVLEAEGVEDEEQAARIQELHDEIEKKLPPGYAASYAADTAGGGAAAGGGGGGGAAGDSSMRD
jgi:tetratricopeptide (TPR) repeat protein